MSAFCAFSPFKRLFAHFLTLRPSSTKIFEKYLLKIIFSIQPDEFFKMHYHLANKFRGFFVSFVVNILGEMTSKKVNKLIAHFEDLIRLFKKNNF